MANLVRYCLHLGKHVAGYDRTTTQLTKRPRPLGELTRGSRAVCVAGSHGKTTVSSMTANILRESRQGCNAFLGGILRNTGSNLLLHPGSDTNGVEATRPIISKPSRNSHR